MQKRLLFIFLFFIFTHTVFPNDGKTFSLTVRVNNLRNDRGIIQFTLYNTAGTIPDEHYKHYYKIKKATIKKSVSYAVFHDLPKGRYAINIFHDENKNGKIDKGWILPVEGIGFSNYKSIGLTNRPNYKKASFMLNTNINKIIKMIYF